MVTLHYQFIIGHRHIQIGVVPFYPEQFLCFRDKGFVEFYFLPFCLGKLHLFAFLAFCGASVGSVIRYFLVKKQFNLFLSIIMASFATTMIAGMDTIFHLGTAPEMTLATSVLYLIPGVPLLNSVIDLLEGYFSASIARSMFAASLITCIAVGMTLSIMLLGINNF
jgi:uncharacterized membrane protein YjjB (DUF3815 family)